MNQQLFFRTNTDEVVLAGAQNAISMSEPLKNKSAIPYLLVRDSLRARISRPVYYELAELLQPQEFELEQEETQHCVYGIYSESEFFAMGRVE